MTTATRHKLTPLQEWQAILDTLPLDKQRDARCELIGYLLARGTPEAIEGGLAMIREAYYRKHDDDGSR